MIDLEKIVLGTIITEPSVLEDALLILRPEMFTGDNLTIYHGVLSLVSNKQSIDLISLSSELKGKIKVTQIAELATGYYNPNQFETHCRLLAQELIKKKLITLNLTLNHKITENDVFDVLGWINTEVKKIEGSITGDKIMSLNQIKNDLVKEIKDSLISGKRTGVETGIVSLDNQTNGWQKSDLIILAGRPAMGKTSAAIQFSLHPAMNGKPTAFFSLEMSKEQLVTRILSLISCMPVQKIVTRNLTKYDVDLLERDGQVLNNVPLFIDDSASLSIIELTAKARRLKREKGIELIVVDYLQLMKGSGQNRENEISDISRGLKILAKELNIPIIALSQLSRAVESRSNKKPILSDLRESGAIEQDADLVMFTFRPEYYDFPTYEIGDNQYPSDGLMVFIISKFRQGSVGEVKARWIGELTKIDNYL